MKKEFSVTDLWKNGVGFDYGPEVIEYPYTEKDTIYNIKDTESICNLEELKKTFARRIDDGE